MEQSVPPLSKIDTGVRPILGTRRSSFRFGLPNRRPPDFFFGRFDAHMESRFVLITCWYINSYGISQFCDDPMEHRTERSRIRQRLVHGCGMFMHDAFIKHKRYHPGLCSVLADSATFQFKALGSNKSCSFLSAGCSQPFSGQRMPSVLHWVGTSVHPPSQP